MSVISVIPKHFRTFPDAPPLTPSTYVFLSDGVLVKLLVKIPSTQIIDIQASFQRQMRFCTVFLLTCNSIYILFLNGTTLHRIDLQLQVQKQIPILSYLHIIESRVSGFEEYHHEINVLSNQNNRLEISYCSIERSNKTTYTVCRLMKTRTLPPICMSVSGNIHSHGRSALFCGLNENKDSVLFIYTPTDEPIKLCKAFENLYNSVGFCNSATQLKPSHKIRVTPRESIPLMDQ